MGFVEVNKDEFELNPFKFWGKDWALVTAGTKDNVNTMTVGWGSLGELWQKNVAVIYIRPQRYTKEFVDKNDKFSITSFGEERRSELAYLGKVSGKQEDKIKKAGLTVAYDDGVPYISEGKIILICRKLYENEINPALFIDKSIDNFYPEKDYHIQYIAEVEKILVRE
jgi:flavin reductase (DIM6/NTAB) family NADH-FMN oxidoreductase RutF